MHDAAVLGAISLSFALGAVKGGLITRRLHDAALCVPAARSYLNSSADARVTRRVVAAGTCADE
jgi:uncharacterized membrane protein YoaK (UPF0700 family)